MDDADKVSCRPDFQILIYPGGLTKKDEGDNVAPEVAVTTNTPPTFIAMAGRLIRFVWRRPYSTRWR